MEKTEQIYDHIRMSSAPSKLKITDMSVCRINIPPWGSHLLRLETNQGIVGYGELRDGASPTYVKMLKSRIIGENPCTVEKILNKISQFGSMARQSAGISAVEVALCDLA